MGSKKIERRIINPDPVYNSVVVGRLINQIMRKGKKTIARKIVYGAFGIIKEKTKKNPQEIFDLAVRNTTPLLEVKPKRVGGATYQVPREVKGDRRLALSMRWLINGAKGRKGKGSRYRAGFAWRAGLRYGVVMAGLNIPRNSPKSLFSVNSRPEIHRPPYIGGRVRGKCRGKAQ